MKGVYVRSAQWDDAAKVQQLTVLWDGGLSATEIAIVLGGGLTRNAVMGKVNRLGLTARAREPRTKTTAPVELNIAHHAAKPRPCRPLAKSAPNPTPAPLTRRDGPPVTLWNVVYGECRFPMWPDGETGAPSFGLCGHATQWGSSYCSAHFAKSCGTGTSGERGATKAAMDLSMQKRAAGG